MGAKTCRCSDVGDFYSTHHFGSIIHEVCEVTPVCVGFSPTLVAFKTKRMFFSLRFFFFYQMDLQFIVLADSTQ